MAALLNHRCLHHPTREAVARCPECTQFFCRECITEHDDRVICSSCLRKIIAQSATQTRRSFAPLARGVAAAGGLLIAWLFFFLIGRMLVNIPSSVHEGTVWERDWLDTEER